MFVSKEAYREAVQRLLDHNEHQEEQIERLVDGILAIPEWMSRRGSHICPFCKGMYPSHSEDCLRGLASAIKEATG